MNPSPHAFRSGILLATFAATGLASKAIFAKLAYRHGVDATTLVTLRLAFTLPMLLVVRLVRKELGAPIARRDWGWIVFLGVIGYYLASLLDFIGLQTVSASIERLIMYLYPTLTVLLSAWLMKTPITPRMKQALPLTYLGIALVLAPDLIAARADWFGVGMIVVSTVLFAFYLTWSPAVIGRVGAMRFTELALGASGLAMLLHYLLSHPAGGLIGQAWPVYAYALAMALVATVLPIYAMSAAMARIGSGRTAIVGSFGPVLTIFMGMGLLDERLSLPQWAGVALVMLGVWWVGQRRG